MRRPSSFCVRLGRLDRLSFRRGRTLAISVLLCVSLVMPAGSASAAGPVVAVPGPAQTVKSGVLVTLDGSASTVPTGPPVTYTWAQLTGPSVEFASRAATDPVARFYAPLVASSTELSFRLTVTDADNVSSHADVIVTVLPGNLPQKLSFQSGRSGWQDIASEGRNVYVTWCYRAVGDALHIYVARSTDGGLTFERPQRLSQAGDCDRPVIEVDGQNVYIAWRQHVPGGARVVVARSATYGIPGTWRLDTLATGASFTSDPEIAAATEGGDHNLFVLYESVLATGSPLVLATTTGPGQPFELTTVEPNADYQPETRDVATVGDVAYVSYLGSDGEVKLYSRSASSGAEKRGGLTPLATPHGTRIAASPDGRACVTWSTMVGDTRAYASVLDSATLSGVVTQLQIDASAEQAAPDIAWSGDAFVATWIEIAQSDGVLDRVCTGRVRTGGGLTDPQKVAALTSGANGSYHGRMARSAGVGGIVAIGWWDQYSGRAYTTISRDGGHTWDPQVDHGTWIGDSNVEIASNESSASPVIHAALSGNLRIDSNDNVECDVYAKRLASVAENNLVLERVRVVQAPWDDSAAQRLAKDKKTAFRVDVASGYDTPVTTDVELRYTQVTGGVANQTVMTQQVTIAPYETKHVDFTGIRPTGDSVGASATCNPAHSPVEVEYGDNSAELGSRTIVETRKLDGLYVPIMLAGDSAPSAAQFTSAMSSWNRFLADVYPIDDDHWLKRTTWTTNWTPDLPGFDGTRRLTDAEYASMETQLFQAAKVTGHEVAIGVVRQGWFAKNAQAEYSGAVGLAPQNSKLHAGVEEVGQPAQVAAHEIGHTFGLVPTSAPGVLTATETANHYERMVATGYSASRGEIALSDPKNPPLDMMDYLAQPNPWISAQTYELLIDALSVSNPDPEVVLVSGAVDRSAITADVRAAYRFVDDADLALGSTGDMLVVLKDGADATIGSAGFDPAFARSAAGLSGGALSDTAAFAMRVPWVPGTEKIELVYKGTTVATLPVTANAPTVSVTAPTGGSVVSVGETVTVSWSGSDADGGTLHYVPMLSIDDGVSWSPLCAETSATGCSFAVTRQQVTETAKVKVMVTDGVNSGSDVTAAFAIRPVTPTSVGGGGKPTWGPILGFPKASGVASDPVPDDWTIGANGDTVWAAWIAPNTLWDPNQYLRILRSQNRGATWQPVVEAGGALQLSSDSESFSQMQPFVFAGGDTIYTMTAENIDSTHRKLVVRKSSDGGQSFPTTSVVATWSPSPSYPRLMRPRIAVSGSRVYVLAEVLASASAIDLWLYSSSDGGATFGAPVVLASGPWNGVGSLGYPKMFAKDDDVYVAFKYGNTNLFGPPDAALVASHDGGASFSAPQVVLTNVYYPTVAADGQNVHVAACYYDSSTVNGIKAVSSTDYGATFGTAQDSGGSARVDSDLGSPRLLARGDKVAAVWRGQETSGATTRFPIYSWRSTDAGQTWGSKANLYDLLPGGSPALTDSGTLAEGYTRTEAQGDSVYVATQIREPYTDGFGGSGTVRRLAVFTSADFGETYSAPDTTTLDPVWENTKLRTVLALTPGLVYAGAGVDTYFTELNAFLRVGATGAAPAVAAGPDLTVAEGQTAALTAEVKADSLTGATAQVDWGDGTVATATVSGGDTTGTIVAEHAYGLRGTYVATVRLNAGGKSAEDTVAVTVTNAPPVLSVPTTRAVTTFGLQWQPGEIRYSDLGWKNTITATIDWGDGATTPATATVTATGAAGVAQMGIVEGAHQYASPGTYDVAVTVSDGSAETSASFSVTAEVNSDPTADAGGPYVVSEGSAFSLDASASTDPDPDALEFEWTLQGKVLGSVLQDNRQLTAMVPDDLSTSVGLKVSDGRGGISADSAAVTVLNVAPTVSADPSATIDSAALVLSPRQLATFADAGVLDTHTATVDWGDSHVTTATVTESGGSGSVVAGHSYSAPGTYTATVSVTDDDGGVGSTELTIVASQPPLRLSRVSGADRYQVSVAVARSGFDPAGDGSWPGVTDVVIASGENAAASDPLSASGMCWAHDAPLLLVKQGSVPTTVSAAIAAMASANGTITVHVVGGTGSVPNARLSELSAAVGGGKLVFDRVLATGNRYDLAAAIARRVKAANGGVVPAAVLVANGADSTKYFDAMALSAITAHQGYPIVLVSAVSVPTATQRLLAEFDAASVIIAGGTGTVSSAVYAKAGGTERWSGANRYATAATIAEKALAKGWLGQTTVYVAGALPDALTGGAGAGRSGGPLLLTTPVRLSPETDAWLVKHEATIDTCVVYGGTASVSAATYARIEAILE